MDMLSRFCRTVRFWFMPREGRELALREAVREGNADEVRFCLAHGVRIEKDSGVKALWHAARRGDRKIAELLIDGGVDVDAVPPEYHERPLSVAVQGGHREVAELLLARGASVDAPDKDGSQPLHMACMSGSMETVELLLDRGAPVEAVGQDGWRPLHVAALFGTRDIVELLIARGAEIEAADKDGDRPLHRASGNDRMEAAEALLAHGADTRARNKWGQTPRAMSRLKTMGALLDAAEKEWKAPEERKLEDLAALRAHHRKLGALRPRGPSL